jgi:hypothetical protein
MSSYPEQRFAASEFLRDVVPARCLAHLRFLELVFPAYEPLPPNDHPAVQDWCGILDWVRGIINAPALVIRFVMAELHFQAVGDARQGLTEEQGYEILFGYMRVMHPVKPLVREDGLAGFYVQAAYPWRWTKKTRGKIRRHGVEWLDKAERDLKGRYERAVRGLAAASCNKPEPTPSGWQRLYSNTRYLG